MSQGITHLGLRNFKAFHYLDDLELKPLTVLVGPNSSGKSSILQSLLLLKQSLLSAGSKSVLKFDGDLVQLGSFDSVISGFDTTRPLEYRFRFASMIPVHELKRYFPHRPIPENVGQATVKLDSSYTLSFAQSEKGPIQVAINQRFAAPPVVRDDEAGPDELQDLIIASLQTEPEGPPVTAARLYFEKFLPLGVLLKTETESKDSDRAHGLGEQVRTPAFPLSRIPLLAQPVQALRRLLVDRLEHLGPVRADPRPFYPVAQDPEIGPRGDGAIPYLLRHQDDPLDLMPAPGGEISKGTLLQALNAWLMRMGITQQLTLDLMPNVAFTAKLPVISAPSRPVDLSQVGFGVSQLLPVLLLGLKEPRDGFILYEQPESQLHPRLQADLGDFFLAMARGGKTILLETHSDYLVNRLRRRIAEDPTGALAQLVSIVFVHAGTADNPSSYVEPLSVGPDGTILNCPEDFFSEAADEAFALMRARIERSRRE